MMHRLQTIGTIEEVLAPPFTLPSAHDGTAISIHVFRQRQPVGLLFVPQATDVPTVLNGVQSARHKFRSANAVLLVVVREPFPAAPSEPVVLVDDEGHVFRRYECSGRMICLFGLDRYGAVVHRSTCEVAELVSALRELLDAIEFSEIQCPE